MLTFYWNIECFFKLACLPSVQLLKHTFFPLVPARKHTKQDSNLNEEWKSMFGSLDPPSSAPTPQTVPNVLVLSSGGEPNGALAGEHLRSESSSQTLILPHVPSSAQVDRWADSVLSIPPSLYLLPALSLSPFPLPSFYIFHSSTLIASCQSAFSCNAEK